jgi:hypothetical protein
MVDVSWMIGHRALQAAPLQLSPTDYVSMVDQVWIRVASW